VKTIKALGVDSNFGYCQGSSHRAVHELKKNACVASLAQAGLAIQWQQIGALATTHPHSHDDPTNKPTNKPNTLETQLAVVNRQLASQVHDLVAAGQRFLVLGGDHSIAMGTWSGALAACRQRSGSRAQSLGLLWIDAHLDAHSFASSPSGNIHGMPLRALLNDADPRLRRLCPQSGHLCGKNLALIGIRSFEPAEKKFLEEQQVSITYMHDMPRADCGPTLLRALGTLSKRCGSIGISLDIDAIDPRNAPGVATPEAGGLPLSSLCKALKRARLFNKLVGLEICEYDPAEDAQQRTRHAVLQLIKAIF